MPATELKGNEHRFCAIDCEQPFTHVRVQIFPDGGLARLRVYGKPFCDWSTLAAGQS